MTPPESTAHGPMDNGDSDHHGLPLGSLLGLLSAAFVAGALLLNLGGDATPDRALRAAHSMTPVPATPLLTVPSIPPATRSGSPPPRPTVYYFVSDAEQAQVVAAGFTGGATVGPILLAGTPEEEQRAWRIVGDLNVAHEYLTAHPPRVIDLREPARPATTAP